MFRKADFIGICYVRLELWLQGFGVFEAENGNVGGREVVGCHLPSV